MPYTNDSTGARHARDRNVFEHDRTPGPYESRYDVRRGYDEPLPAVRRRGEPRETLMFRGRDERE